MLVEFTLHHTPLLPLQIGLGHPTLYQLFLARISWHLLILDSYIAFTVLQPFAAAQAFAVAEWLARTLPNSFGIIVDSLLGHLG